MSWFPIPFQAGGHTARSDGVPGQKAATDAVRDLDRSAANNMGNLTCVGFLTSHRGGSGCNLCCVRYSGACLTPNPRACMCRRPFAPFKDHAASTWRGCVVCWSGERLPPVAG
jgi:hypothetical protein